MLVCWCSLRVSVQHCMCGRVGERSWGECEVCGAWAGPWPWRRAFPVCGGCPKALGRSLGWVRERPLVALRGQAEAGAHGLVDPPEESEGPSRAWQRAGAGRCEGKAPGLEREGGGPGPSGWQSPR